MEEEVKIKVEVKEESMEANAPSLILNGIDMNESAYEKKLRLKREAKRKETPEEKEARLAVRRVKEKEYRKRRAAEMSEEEKRIRWERDEKTRRARREREREVLDRAKLASSNGQGTLPPELEEEEREVLEKRRKRAEWQRNKFHRMKEENPEMYEEKLQRHRFNQMVRKATMTEEEKNELRMKKYLYKHAYLAKRGRGGELPPEEKERRRLEQRERLRSLEGEKKERYLASVHKAQKKYFSNLKERNPDKFKEIQDKHKAYQRARYANETPEERARRRQKDRICGAKRKLRAALMDEGVAEEEIQRRLQQLWVKMWREFDPEGEVPSGKRGVRKGERKRRRKAASEAGGVAEMKEAVEVDFSGDGPSTSGLTFVIFDPSAAGTSESYQIDDYFGDDGGEPHESYESPLASGPQPPPENTSSNLSAIKIEDPTAENLEDPDHLPPTGRPGHPRHVECSHCFASALNDTQLRSHIRTAHPDKCWKCPKCNEVMLSPQELMHHFQFVHKSQNKQVQKPVEKVQFVQPKSPVPRSARKEDLEGPCRQLVDPDPKVYRFLCLRCAKTPSSGSSSPSFKTKAELLDHVRRKHVKYYWPCDRCKLLKYSKSSLKFHQSICLSPGPGVGKDPVDKQKVPVSTSKRRRK